MKNLDIDTISEQIINELKYEGYWDEFVGLIQGFQSPIFPLMREEILNRAKNRISGLKLEEMADLYDELDLEDFELSSKEIDEIFKDFEETGFYSRLCKGLKTCFLNALPWAAYRKIANVAANVEENDGETEQDSAV